MSDLEFTIEDNIEIPKRDVNFGPRGSKYPVDQLNVGQSFAVLIEVDEPGKVTHKDGTETELTLEETVKRKAAQLQSMFSSLAKKRDIKIATRFIAEGDPKGANALRVWRIEDTDESEDGGSEDAGAEGAEQADAGNDEFDL